MIIKDIVNRDNVNLENCDQEPIHIPGTIQPHGFLLAIDLNTKKIKFCSGNVDVYLGIPHEKILDKNISEIFNEEASVSINALFTLSPGKVSVLKTSVAGNDFDFIAHNTDNYLIIEAEKQQDVTKTSDLVDLSRDFVTAMEDTQTLKELCDLVAVSIKKITGYDRVMVYRFDEQYNGEVLSESKNDDLEGFLGLHYPHTDIPAQARQLYIKNQLRVIVDVNYVPTAIFTTENVKNDALDLSLSVLRSVSPIHIQYLQNMGVGGTLTISLLLRGKLWGLIACHHYSAKYLTYDVRMSAKLLGHFITSQIDSRNLNEEYEIRNKVNQAVSHFGSQVYELNRNSLEKIINDPAILQVCNADGFAAVINHTIYKFGITPNDETIKLLSQQCENGQHFKTESLKTDLAKLELKDNDLPGINLFSFKKGSNDCLIWFRQESLRDVNWAGDPGKSIEKDKNGLSPRKSFALYQQTVKDHSKPWLESEISASSGFANFFEKHLNSVLLSEEEEKQRQLANTLIQTNAELENINYISTHDLQEPLRKIQMTASVLLGNKNEHISPDVLEKIVKMNQFAGRMQFLIKDILKYTQLNYGTAAFENVNLAELLRGIKSEMVESLVEKDAKLDVEEMPSVNGVSFLLKQLFTNLINNSLKFSDPSRLSTIKIALEKNAFKLPPAVDLSLTDYHIIKYTDNGVGFEPEDNEKIFKIFTRLYNSQSIVGSGIGLAICRKIMQTHNGYIFAEGKPNKGATFRILFPKKLMEIKK
ncbi:MAG: GAF domain-containing protein [Bacteroidia bacterium]|nr:GAF domain-containing protein [Bacteroidia bacterium]